MDELDIKPIHPLPIDALEIGCSHAPWLPDGLFATRQWDFHQMSHPVKMSVGSDEEFPAPEVAVAPITRPVPSYADHWPLAAILRHTTGDVRMVMLNSDMWEPFQRPCIVAGEVPRMKIIGDGLRDDFEEPFEVLDALDEGAIRLIVLQLADVVAQEGKLSLD
jgi:hypothetical protein